MSETHSTDYWHLNCDCDRMYLFDCSSVTQDFDAGYDVNPGLGAWTATAGCASADGGSLVFHAAMR